MDYTCGVVVKWPIYDLDHSKLPQFCNEPATFRYWGLKEFKNGMTPKQYFAQGQIILELCTDHSRDTFLRMEPALKDGTATMRCLVQDRLTIHCNFCHSLFRFEPLKPATLKVSALGNFCPNCGQPATSTYDPQLDWWELVTKDLNLPVALTQQIYSLWQADRTATAKFVDYVQSAMQEIGL